MTEQLAPEEYEALLGRNSGTRRAAHERALEIRKFEIDLYWRRASYFWTLIGASLVAYGAAQALASREMAQDVSVFASSLGFVFSFAWYCVNRGSKQWQENWESHVDLLEDEETGPLYKVVVRRVRERGILKQGLILLTGPGSFSVSKINQLVSVYVTLVWIGLGYNALRPLSLDAPMRGQYVVLVTLTLATALAIWFFGRTRVGDNRYVATLRQCRVILEKVDDNAPDVAIDKQ